eukprot:TRINITY_DN14590_c0_g1_i1.p1 TRINITY_DN14590_c0_g1~~TRINITY_DN14590_c0_g1_i1.p1  ORF type:complete len:318 (+),score=17.69 TRINITY_DN14590_c0_g1_i1:388-1341(+)
MLDCCKDLQQVKEEGITIEKVACLALCNGALANYKLFGEFSLEQFRQEVQECSEIGTSHIIASYSRKELNQTGDGHFSPIGGYNAQKDLVLILDTACFKYPPHWVPLGCLYKAMSHVDPATKQPRGYLKIQAKPRIVSLLYTLNVNHPRYAETIQQIVKCATQQYNKDTKTWLQDLYKELNMDDLEGIVLTREYGCTYVKHCTMIEKAMCDLMREIQGLPLFQILSRASDTNHSDSNSEKISLSKLTIFLLALKDDLCQDSIIDQEIQYFLDLNLKQSSLIALEVEYLRQQRISIALESESSHNSYAGCAKECAKHT